MSTDPIRRLSKTPQAPDVAAAASVGGPQAVSPTAKAFQVAPSAPTSAPTAVNASSFATLRDRIAASLAKNLDHEAIIDDLVGFETTRCFGDGATPALRASVADRFRTDPILKSLVSNLINAVATSAPPNT